MELDIYCPLSGKNCTTVCAWYTDDDCNFGNLYLMANKMSDIAGQLEEIRDSVNDLNDAVGNISSTF